jgi:hypothetical protein
VEISIGELRSTVRTSQPATLDPALVERIVALVLARVREEQERQRRTAAGRRLLADDGRAW